MSYNFIVVNIYVKQRKDSKIKRKDKLIFLTQIVYMTRKYGLKKATVTCYRSQLPEKDRKSFLTWTTYHNQRLIENIPQQWENTGQCR